MASSSQPVAQRAGQRVVAAYCRRAIRREVDVAVEGLEHLPPTGPVLVVARHFHHLFDGCILYTEVSRPVHILVAHDWVRPGAELTLMRWGCRSLEWPALLRPTSAAARAEPTAAFRSLRDATATAVDLLRRGELLVVFPEGYPNVDPRPTPKVDEQSFLPFQPGFLRFAAMAERANRHPVPIVPAGFSYRRGPRWQVTVRFGSPLYCGARAEQRELVRTIERRVRELSEDLLPGARTGSPT